MCTTQEGLAKGERWCKRAIWGNTLPAVKREWKSVDRLTSGAFVAMWRDRVDILYARYPAPTLQRPEQLEMGKATGYCHGRISGALGDIAELLQPLHGRHVLGWKAICGALAG